MAVDLQFEANLTIQTAYQRTLNGIGWLGANWRYVAVVPVQFGGAAFRLRFTAPTAANTDFQSVYAGSGPVTVNGASIFTVPAGKSVWSDVIASPVVSGQQINVAYDAVGGSGRAYASSAASGQTLYYKSGLGGASNASPSVSGYTTLTDFTAAISGVEVGDVADFSTPVHVPEDEEEGSVTWQDWGLAAIANDEIYARGDFLDGRAGEILHVDLVNPPNTGKLVALWCIEVTPEKDTRFSIRSVQNQLSWPSIPAICNARWGDGVPYAKARLKYGYASNPMGGAHSVGTLRAGVMTRIWLPHCPLVTVPPTDAGVCLALHTAGCGASVTFHWQEIEE